MKKCYYAIGGLLYSGEHILANIFRQNKNINLSYVDAKNLLKLGNYEHDYKKVTVDICANWGFLTNYEIHKHNICDERLIITVRSTVDCAAHCVKYFCKEQTPEIIKNFLATSEEIKILKRTYVNLQELYKKYPDKITLIYHDDIINNTQLVINQLHEYLDLKPYEYDLSFLKFYEKIDAKKILGEFYDSCDQETFWDIEEQSKKPAKRLDTQLKLAINGKFDESLEILNKIVEEEPLNDRAAFNLGWFKIRNGKLWEGHNLLDRGRFEGVFGNAKPTHLLNIPIWEGNPHAKVLYYLEGGLGDQIHGLKYVSRLKKYINNLSICCLPELKTLLIKNGYTNVYTQTESMYESFDNWIPAMSVISLFGLEYKDLDGEPYFAKKSIKNEKFTIGLRWSGNPKFEHQQHRKFPLDLFFNSVYNENFDYINLQRDDDSELCPDWVKKVKLDDWTDTQEAINQCDLIISSCTSVAHLSAAMGVPTWIIVPILPYYLWALPGDTTPHYNGVTLFRQEIYGDWNTPMKKIKEKLYQYESGYIIKNT